MRRIASAAWLGGAVALAACVGDIGDPNGPGVDPTSCSLAQPGPSPMRRLTRWEYDHTVHDLLGDTTQPAKSFIPEAVQFGFDNGALGATLSSVVIEQYEVAATTLAKNAAADLPSLLGCDPAISGEDACVQAFIPVMGKRAFRRPLTAEETERFSALYTTSRVTEPFRESVEMIVSAMLQSPHFLYRIELGTSDPEASGAVRLSSWEVATRLSYLLWGSMPDDALFHAAEVGELETKQQVRAQAERLLADERGARAIQNFYAQWSGANSLGEVERSVPFTPGIAALQKRELELFVDAIVRTGDGSFASLLTSNVTFLNDELAVFYGLPAPGSTDFVPVELDASRYPGLMTRGAPMAFLAHPEQSSIVGRGKFLLEKLMCAPPPAPPCNADTSLPPIDPETTAREQLETKTSVEPCNGCHMNINPPGFAFEHFDQMGRWRDDEHGLALDTSGELRGTDVAGPFAGHADLLARIATSQEARDCTVTTWFRYAFGRDVTDGDACTMSDLELGFAETDGNIRELLLALTQSDAFLYRSGTGGGQ